MADTLNFWHIFANHTRRLVGRVLVEELGELGVDGKGGLDRDEGVGGEVCYSGDYADMSVFRRPSESSQWQCGHVETHLLRRE
jgi:hypothetical protein